MSPKWPSAKQAVGRVLRCVARVLFAAEGKRDREMTPRFTLLVTSLMGALCAACVETTSQSSQPPALPKPTAYCAAPNVRSASGPVPSAHVSIGGKTGVTNADGYVYLANVPAGVYALSITAKGYFAYHGEFHINSWACDMPITLRHARVDLPRLRARGAFFELETGQRWTAIEASDFNLYARFLAGQNIEPILAQRASLGFNLLRVWTAYDIRGVGRLIPAEHKNFYAKIPEFLQAAAKHGLRVEFTGYTGINDPDHWSQLVASVASSTNVILELVNELSENVNEPDDLGRIFDLNRFERPPPPILASHGSNGSQALAVRPWWGYEVYHSNVASDWARKVGHNAMEFADGTADWAGSHVPILANENTRGPDRFHSPQQAFDAAAGAALLAAGSCFHSVSGKTSELWGGLELELARAWAAGATSVPLACQDGPYVHRQDLEGPPDLRVYQRGSDPACIVKIRK